MIGPGDLVVCVRDGICRCGCGDDFPQRRGAYYTVASTFIWHSIPALTLAGIEPETANHYGYPQSDFRKIESDPDLAEITERIKKCQPMKQGADA